MAHYRLAAMYPPGSRERFVYVSLNDILLMSLRNVCARHFHYI